MTKLPAGRMPIGDALSYCLRTATLPLNAVEREAINTMLAWEHAGTEYVLVNQ